MPNPPKFPKRPLGPGKPLRKKRVSAPAGEETVGSKVGAGIGEAILEDNPLSWLSKQIQKDRSAKSTFHIKFGGNRDRGESYIGNVQTALGLEGEEKNVFADSVGMWEEQEWKDPKQSRVIGDGKYDVSIRQEELLNPLKWGGVIKNNAKSLAYQFVYYQIEEQIYKGKLYPGGSGNPTTEYLKASVKSLNQRAADLYKIQNKLGPKAEELVIVKEGKVPGIRIDFDKGLAFYTVPTAPQISDLKKLNEAQEEFKKQEELVTQQYEEFKRQADAAQKDRIGLRKEKENVNKRLSALEEERKRRFGEGRLLAEQKGEGDLAALFDERGRLDGEAEKLDQEKQVLLKQQKALQGKDQIESGKKKIEEAKGRWKDLMKQRRGIDLRIYSFRTQDPQLKKVLADLAGIKKQTGDLRKRKGEIATTIKKASVGRKNLARNLMGARRQIKYWRNGQRLVVYHRTRQKITEEMNRLTPWMREWLAPRAHGQTLFNGRDQYGIEIKSSGRLWQLQDFIHNPIGYSLRSFIWKGDPLPGGHHLLSFNLGKDAKGNDRVVRGLKELIFGNKQVQPFLGKVRPDSPTGNLLKFFEKGFFPSFKDGKLEFEGLKAIGRYSLNNVKFIFNALRPVLQFLLKLVQQLAQLVLKLAAKLLPGILGLAGGAGAGAGVGAASTGAAAAGAATAAGGAVTAAGGAAALAGEEVVTGVGTAGVKPAIEISVVAIIGLVMIVVGVILLAVIAIISGLKDYKAAGGATAAVSVIKTVDVLDTSGNPTGSNRITVLDGIEHRVRYSIKITNSSAGEITDVTLTDSRCGETFTLSSVAAGVTDRLAGTCEISVVADLDKVVLNQVTGSAYFEGALISLSASGILIVGNPADEPPSGWPLSQGCISQGPGGAFSHTSTGTVYGNALDIVPSNDSGYNVIATHGGTAKVYYSTAAAGAGPYPGFGYYVVITSVNGAFGSVYGHLETINVVDGQSVVKGQIIGRVNSTVGPGGTSTGDHLHYGLSGVTMGAPYIPANVPPCSGMVPDPGCGSVLNLNAGQNCFKP